MNNECSDHLSFLSLSHSVIHRMPFSANQTNDYGSSKAFKTRAFLCWFSSHERKTWNEVKCGRLMDISRVDDGWVRELLKHPAVDLKQSWAGNGSQVTLQCANWTVFLLFIVFFKLGQIINETCQNTLVRHY